MEILKDKGKISHWIAISFAEKEYEGFRIEQDKNYISDFDAIMKRIEKLEKDDKNDKREWAETRTWYIDLLKNIQLSVNNIKEAQSEYKPHYWRCRQYHKN